MSRMKKEVELMLTGSSSVQERKSKTFRINSWMATPELCSY